MVARHGVLVLFLFVLPAFVLSDEFDDDFTSSPGTSSQPGGKVPGGKGPSPGEAAPAAQGWATVQLTAVCFLIFQAFALGAKIVMMYGQEAISGGGRKAIMRAMNDDDFKEVRGDRN